MEFRMDNLMSATIEGDSISLLESLAQTKFADCYQCGKCTAGCPRAAHMDKKPNQIVHLAQLGEVDAALESDAIWQCVSCETCTARCPKSVDCAAIMDALRQVSFERGITSKRQAAVVLFQKAFLDSVRRNGRVNEVEMIAQYKLEGFAALHSPGFLLNGATLAPRLQMRGKLHVLGERARDRALVRRIFARCMDGKE
jgi:heterodisulfide reductase subunit C2